MGEWSDYFEDYPEEDPANQVNGVYSEELALQRLREREMQNKNLSQSQKVEDLRKAQQDILLKLKGIK